MTFYSNNKVIVSVVIYSKILIAEVCIYHLTSICPGFFNNGAVWQIYGLHVIIRGRTYSFLQLEESVALVTPC